MPKITLSGHWRPRGEVYEPGDVVDVDDETAAYLRSAGVAAGDKPARPTPKQEVHDEPEAEPTPDVQPQAHAPAKTAPLDEWKRYAIAQGIDPKGLSKREIIAAVS